MIDIDFKGIFIAEKLIKFTWTSGNNFKFTELQVTIYCVD